LSNQKKLSEFYEELKRLNIKVIRPDINKCYSNFYSDGKNFYYALGAIKNVGYEAISNLVKEREKNGEFKNISDFVNRANPKDINKLQLEGLVRAGAFDNLNENRQSLFNSIPNIILKSKNVFENKSLSQIDLFTEDEQQDNSFIDKIDDWNVDTRLTKEFESLGFFISDHPLNQYKSIFNQYNIVNYEDFEKDKNILSSNIACTVLKIQEKKTQKGNSYAIVKFSDLSGIFELFIFSDIFEMNRDVLHEGKSLMITLFKNYVDDSKIQKKINVKKIILLKDILNKPIEHLKFNFKNIDELEKIKNLSKIDGNTTIELELNDDNTNLTFKLKDKRKIDHKLINSLKIKENIVID